MSIKVDPALKALIPPLSTEERDLLEQNILAHGCRDPLVVWQGVLLDGHNRLEICERHGLPYKTAQLEFESVEQARVWMRNNQMGRRNLSTAWRIDLQLANKEDLLKIGAAKRVEAGKEARDKQLGVLSQNDKTPAQPKHNTQAEIAKAANTSTGMVGMAEVVRKQAPELWEKAKKGDVSVTTAYKEVQKQDKVAKRKEKKQKIESTGSAVEAAITTPIDPVDTEEPPIVEINGHVLMFGDNSDPDIISRIPSSIALAFCDPPYNSTQKEWDGNHVWSQDWLIDMAKIVAVTPGISSIPAFMQQTKMPYRWSTATHINNGMTRGALGFGNWIYTALFSKSESIHRNAQDHSTVSIKPSDKFENHSLGSQRQKPPSYLVWLFDLLTNDGETILDPFAGSGTSVIAAHKLGRKCIAIEKDKKTYQAMVKRVRCVMSEG